MTEHYDELDEELPEPPSPYHVPEVEEILNRVADIVENARPMPLSSMSMVNKEEILDLLDEAIERLPEELRAARWLLKEREEFLDRVRREGEEILERARSRAERMVQRTEVVKAAEQRARQILDAAEREARRMRHEVEDYCDQKLAGFEVILERTLRFVQAGREKLQATTFDRVDDEPEDSNAAGFFDQEGYSEQGGA